MGLLAELASDVSKEQEGVWVTYPNTDIEFKIARLNNPAHIKQSKKIARKFKNAGFTETKLLMAPSVAKNVLVGWKNLSEPNEKGKIVEIPYSAEKALEILRKPEMGNIYDFILEESNDQENYRLETLEEKKGN